MPNVLIDPSATDSMRLSGSMYTLAAPPIIAVGAFFGSIVLCSEIVPVAREFESVAILAGQVVPVTPMHDEDLAPRDVQSAEYGTWARSMMGGDASHMLDI